MEEEKEQPIRRHVKINPMPISNITFERILKLKNNESAILLYMEYCNLVLCQESTQIYATNEWVSKQIGMNIHKLIKAKKSLIELGLIKNIRKRSTDNKGFGKCYVKVNFIFKSDYDVLCQNVHCTKSEHQKRTVLKTTVYKTAHTLNNSNNNTKLQTEIINNNNFAHEANQRIVRKRRIPINNNDVDLLLDKINELTKQNNELKQRLNQEQPKQLTLFEDEELLKEKHFKIFWQLYPNKAAQGTAHSAFSKLCLQKSKANIRPTLKAVKNALKGQIQSELWSKCPQYIPHASTWLNNEGWLNDPEQMKVFKKETNTKSNSSFGYVGKEIKYKEPIKM